MKTKNTNIKSYLDKGPLIISTPLPVDNLVQSDAKPLSAEIGSNCSSCTDVQSYSSCSNCNDSQNVSNCSHCTDRDPGPSCSVCLEKDAQPSCGVCS